MKLAFIITYLLLITSNEPTSITKSPDFISSGDQFKQDMLESIMEFSNDSIPADSLYIPDWLK